MKKTTDSLVAAQGDNEVSVTRFALLKPYDPSMFGAAAKELDTVADRLAEKGGGKVTERATTRVDGRKVRSYRMRLEGSPTRLGFFLTGKTEYQLKCKGDVGEPCDLLFGSFSAA